MSHPSTPSKADDGIEQLKLKLSQRWNIAFPLREAEWSPSRRDPNRVEDKILARIQFLYFKEGALAFAIDEFEKRAITIYSDWQYKPRGDADVLPIYDPPALKQDFLRRRRPLEEGAVRLLTESLLISLDQITDRVRSGEKFAINEMRKPVRPVSVEDTPGTKQNHQSSITQWFHSRSKPSTSTESDITAGGHPPSDDFNDNDVTDAFNKISNSGYYTGLINPNPQYQRRSGSSPRDDKIFDSPLRTRKRPWPGPEPMKPPPTRRSSREKPNSTNSTLPTEGFLSASLSSSRSFDSGSISSSVTNASPASTPNTSFCSDSLVTSFESAAEDTDVTIRPLYPSRSRNPSDQSSLRSNRNSKDSPVLLARDSDLKRSSIVASLAERLVLQTPFALLPFDNDITISFRQIYEIVRVSLHSNLSPTKVSYLLGQTYESYDAMCPIAWERAQQTFEGVAISGKLVFREQLGGPLFDFKLNPLRLESSYRLSRKYGGDRFCIITIPGLGPESLPAHLKPDHAAVRDRIITWLVDTEHYFLGRKWRVFYTRPDSAKRRVKSHSTWNDAKYRIYFFAEDGVGFRQRDHRGEQDPRQSSHVHVTVAQLIEWFMPLNMNLNQPSLKLFTRLKQGVSDTVPTVVFNPREILRCDDARADSAQAWRTNLKRSDEKKRHYNTSVSEVAVMNDGCSRISRPAAIAIAEMLGKDHTPSVYQGRIGGAKGIWMIDCLDEKLRSSNRNFWIEINDSQLKFEGHPSDAIFPDEERVKFEVNDYSRRLAPAALNFQLMPILAGRGVPIKVFRDRLEEDLTLRVCELKVAMDNILSLRKWNQDNNPVSGDRARYGGIEMQGGLPLSRAEKINWFLEHGFEPRICHYLKQQLWQAIHTYCLQLENKMNIGLGRSTYAFMIADPLAILEENEIHLGFSNSFRDAKSKFDETMLHDMDVLVARLPAHLPSDIQKVRATFRPELRVYRDVIVFSSKGSVSLASKLSGGDYDGDKAWICWDEDIVVPFHNAAVPDFPDLDYYGIEKDNTKIADHLTYPDYIQRFLRQAFNFNLQLNMLGPCTNYHEAWCYKRNAIDGPEAISIGVLLGNLVDSAKSGFIFNDFKWTSFLKKIGLPSRLPAPAYRDKAKAKPTNHMIDQLVFDVSKKVREQALGEFDDRFKEASTWDVDLVRIRNEMTEYAKSDTSLAVVLKNLELDLEKLSQFWINNARPDDEDDETRPPRKGNALNFRAVVEKCRGDFLALRPRTDEIRPAITITNAKTNLTTVTNTVSERVQQWQQDCSNPRNDNSSWALVKASVAFHHHHRRAFIWYLAGIELGEIKAMAKGRGTYRVVTNEIFDALKLDSKLVDGMKKRELEMEMDADADADRRTANEEDIVSGYDKALLEAVDWDEGMSQL